MNEWFLHGIGLLHWLRPRYGSVTRCNFSGNVPKCSGHDAGLFRSMSVLTTTYVWYSVITGGGRSNDAIYRSHAERLTLVYNHAGRWGWKYYSVEGLEVFVLFIWWGAGCQLNFLNQTGTATRCWMTRKRVVHVYSPGVAAARCCCCS